MCPPGAYTKEASSLNSTENTNGAAAEKEAENVQKTAEELYNEHVDELRRTGRYKRNRKDVTDPNTLFAKVLILPSMAGVLVFFVVPFLIVIYYAFLDNPISKQFVGFQNFTALFSNKAFLQAAKNTLKLSLTSVPLAVILSLMLASMLNAKIPGRTVFRTFFISPMMVPVASIVLIWQVVFDHKGPANAIMTHIIGSGLSFGEFTLIEPWKEIDWFKSPKCLVVVVLLFLWKNLGYNMILFLSGLNSIPNDLIEVAELEGASALWRMVHIKFRYLSPTFLFVTILSLINSFKLFREIYLLTGSYPYDGLYMLQHFMNNTFLSLDYQKLSSAALVMALVMIVIIGGLFVVEAAFGEDVEE